MKDLHYPEAMRRMIAADAENERLREEGDVVREHWQAELSKAIQVIADVGAERNALRAALAASEARTAVLVEAVIGESDYGYSCNLCCESGPERDAIDHDEGCVLAAQAPAGGEGET